MLTNKHYIIILKLFLIVRLNCTRTQCTVRRFSAGFLNMEVLKKHPKFTIKNPTLTGLSFSDFQTNSKIFNNTMIRNRSEIPGPSYDSVKKCQKDQNAIFSPWGIMENLRSWTTVNEFERFQVARGQISYNSTRIKIDSLSFEVVSKIHSPPMGTWYFMKKACKFLPTETIHKLFS